MALVVFRAGIPLLDEDSAAPRPDRRPMLVRPSETEGQTRVPALEHLLKRSFGQAASGEPVVPVAERLDAVTLGQRGLGLPCLCEPKIIETELARQLRLLVARKQGSRPGDVRPFGEARAPPFIVLLDGVELRQVVRDHPRPRFGVVVHWAGGSPSRACASR